MPDSAARPPDHYSDPHADHERLRETGPVHAVRLPDEREAWIVLGAAEARAVFTDPRFSNDVVPGAEARHMGMSDPPDHTRLRKPLAALFTPRAIRARRPRIRELADGLLASLPTTEPADLVDDYARILPLLVLSDLMGFHPDEEKELVPGLLRLSAVAAEGDSAQRFELAARIQERVRLIVEDACATPRAGALGALARARTGGRLSVPEIESTVFLLIAAGHEAPSDLIALTLLALSGDPELRRGLCAEPARVPGVVEAIARTEAPAVHSTSRRTVEPVTLGGVDIPEGALVLVNLAAANRDAPPSRKTHVSFGQGIHICLGVHLARIEAEIAVTALLARFPDTTIAEPAHTLEWKAGIQMRGIRRLPVRLT